MDFTLKLYRKLCDAFVSKGYQFYTFEEYVKVRPTEKTIVMRHDVDRLPLNALNMATIENELGITSTYYFRTISGVWDEDIVKRIVKNGA